MKKGKIVKFSAATMVALSAITPVAAFANETETTAPGFYTGSTFVPVADFAKLSKTAKKAFLAENIKDNALVLVQNGKVYDMTKEEIQNAPASEVEGLGKTVEEYTAETGKKLTPNGIVDSVTGFTVSSVSAVEATIVEVTFPELSEALTDATVEVKDSKGVVREVVARDIAKGATKAQFDFKTAVKVEDLTGVWTVNGVSYSFDELKLVEDIVAEAGENPVNQVKLYSLLQEAGIKNVDADRIATYAADILGADTTPVWVADVQKIIDQTNEDAGEAADEATVVKAVADATNQIQLLPVLEANFERVNADWIADYAGANVALAAGGPVGMLALNEDNYAGKAGATSVTDIQTTIDTVNNANITTADSDADTATKQTAVTSLIEKYVKADVAPATDKADAVKASKAKEAAYRVAEATTENALYNALVAYATATPDANLKTTELNANLKTYYKTAIDAGVVRTTLKTAINTDTLAAIDGNSGVLTNAIKTSIVGAADAAALAAALDAVGEKATDYDTTSNATNKAAFTKALQQLADFTSHYTVATEKFLVSTIDTELLEEYADALKAITNADDVDTVQQAVKGVNDNKQLLAAVKVVADANSTTAQVRDALTTLALSENANATATAYVDASAQVKLEAAQFIVDNRDQLADPVTKASIVTNGNASYSANAIGKALADHASQVAKFNAIGDLGAATPTTTKNNLDLYAYAPYVALTAIEKVAVAEEINKLTKPVGNPAVDTALDFSGADAVKTLKAANDIIDAAIAKVTAQ